MAYQHNPELPLPADVLPHKPPSLWLSGVLSVEKIPLVQYEAEQQIDVAEFLAQYGSFHKHEKIAAPNEEIVRTRAFFEVPSEHFEGHFPGLPVLMGFRQAEILAQAGGYGAMHENPGELGVFLSDSSMKHPSPVPIGETLMVTADMIGKEGRQFVGLGNVALTNGTITTEGAVSGVLMKKKIQEMMLARAIEAAKTQNA